MEDVIVLIDGAENPVGIAKDLKAMLKRMEKLLKEMNTVKCMFQMIPNTVTIVVIDHWFTKQKDLPTKSKLLTRCQMNLDMLEILWFYTVVVSV
jgi:hypothetical protein